MECIQRSPLIEAVPVQEVFANDGDIEIQGDMVRLYVAVERTAYLGMKEPKSERVVLFRAALPLAVFLRINAKIWAALAPYRKLRVV